MLERAVQPLVFAQALGRVRGVYAGHLVRVRVRGRVRV